MSKLEHDFFGKNQNPSLPKAQQKKDKKDTANGDAKNGQDRLRLNFHIVDDEESWYDFYILLFPDMSTAFNIILQNPRKLLIQLLTMQC